MHKQRIELAAKIRGARAVLGWSQTDLGKRAHLTQRSIHRLEQGGRDSRRSTALAVEKVFQEAGIQFEEIPGGEGFKIIVEGRIFERQAPAERERPQP